MNDHRTDVAIRWGVYALLLLVPLPLGSVRPSGVLAFEIAALILGGLALYAVWRDPACLSRGARVMLIPAALLVGIGIVQLLPLPPGWTRFIAPPTAAAREALGPILPDGLPARAPQSLAPAATLDALLRLTAYVLLGLAAAVGFRNPRHLRGAAVAIAVSGAFQAFYGAAEYLSGHQHIFGYAKRFYLDSATGTFVNRNHYAGYLAASLPFALALLLSGARSLPRGDSWRSRAARLGDAQVLWLFFTAVAVFVIWIGILASYSRSGLAAALLATAVFAAGGPRGRGRLVLLALTVLVPIFYLSWIEVRAPGERFRTDIEELVSLNDRLPVWKGAASLVPEYPLLGSGFGTFEGVYAARHPQRTGLRWDHAHNEWLQCVIEGGPFAGLIGLLFVAGILLARWGRGELGQSPPLFHRSVLAACAALLLQATLDFPLRIPAIAVLAACIAGLHWGQTRAFRLSERSPS